MQYNYLRNDLRKKIVTAKTLRRCSKSSIAGSPQARVREQK